MSSMREFETGASRSSESGRIDPEGYLNPLVLERFCDYMLKHQVTADGKLRSSDNWQKGIPTDRAIKGMWRHMLHLWTRHRGLPVKDPLAAADIEEDLCAIWFNVNVYLWELIRDRIAAEKKETA